MSYTQLPLQAGPSPADAAAELLRRKSARQGILAFTTYTKPDYAVSWHHQILCDHLDRFASGEIKRLMVMMPPRHGKSELVSRRLPAYLLGRLPDANIIATSYSADLASRLNRDVQRIIDAPSYRRLFPGTGLWGSSVRTVAQGTYLRNSDLFEVVGHKGSYRSSGIGGGITGMGGDFLLIDDPVKNREEADSPTVRDSIYEWYTSTLYTRRSSTAGILVCMTRWNPEDLAGKLLSRAEEDPTADQWTILKFPALAEGPLSADDPRASGEALWPERFPVEELAKTRAANPYDWFSLYQQEPRSAGSQEWPDEWFSSGIWFKEWPTDLLFRVQTLDPSKGRDARNSDYSAWVIAGVDRQGNIWVEADLERRPSTKIVEDGLDLYQQHQPRAIGIEVNQFQSLLAVEFRRAARLRKYQTLPVFGITNTVNKQVRIRSIGPYLAQRKLWFKSDSPGTRLLVQQLREFPSGAHDDGPDALDMAIRLIKHLLGHKEKSIQLETAA